MTAIRRKWLAGRDGTAHCTGPFDRWRALCGATAVLERLAWPEERRCRVCVTRAQEEAHAAAH